MIGAYSIRSSVMTSYGLFIDFPILFNVLIDLGRIIVVYNF
jgi:hypothetical protein